MSDLTITDYAPFRAEDAEPKTYTLGEAVKVMVDQSPDYHDGQLEALGRKVEVLTDLVSKLAEAAAPHLDDDTLRSLIQYPLMIEEDENA